MTMRGFSLIELVIVVVIIGVVAAIAVPRLSGFTTSSKYNSANYGFLNITSALDTYYADHQAYPPNSGVGQLPTGMGDYIHESAFTNPSPIGRAWDWNGPGSGINKFGNNLSIHTTSAEERAEIERRFDDGDSNTGLYRNQSHYLIWPMDF